jgi:predicted tellurium resistance membrane protein TerC
MMELLSDPQIWIAFATLTALELVLGIDNIIFISILVDRLPGAQRELARRLGLFMAMFMRIGLLLVLSWLVGLTQPLFDVQGKSISGRDLILIGGGLFLLWKSVSEIHQLLEGEEGETAGAVRATFAAVILQIVSVALMMAFASPIGRFVSAHPTLKILALSFLVVIGVVLIAEGLGHHVPKGYVYFAMAFSVAVEMLNIRMRRRAARPVHLHEPYGRGDGDRDPPRSH